ncbi:MAG: hypothetical protein NTX86_01565 [Candidatus Dependentiae bacterium]|nr:hypothetical protein [Candidatus Dependentiae bacterium]
MKALLLALFFFVTLSATSGYAMSEDESESDNKKIEEMGIVVVHSLRALKALEDSDEKDACEIKTRKAIRAFNVIIGEANFLTYAMKNGLDKKSVYTSANTHGAPVKTQMICKVLEELETADASTVCYVINQGSSSREASESCVIN